MLIVGEHGDYPHNAKGQILYPRYEFFKQCVEVFERDGRAVPVYNDKHLSYSFRKASEMVADSKRLKFPMLAGSSLPVTWRLPELELPLECEIDEALMVGVGSSDPMDYHALEAMQCMVERRRGGETGIKSVQLIEGPAVWDAGEQGRDSKRLLEAALCVLRQNPGQDDGRRTAAGPGRQRRAAQDRAAAGGLLHRTARRLRNALDAQRRGRGLHVCLPAQGGDRRTFDAVLPHADAERYVFRFLGVEDRGDVRDGRGHLPVERTQIVCGISRAASTPKSPGTAGWRRRISTSRTARGSVSVLPRVTRQSRDESHHPQSIRVAGTNMCASRRASQSARVRRGPDRSRATAGLGRARWPARLRTSPAIKLIDATRSTSCRRRQLLQVRERLRFQRTQPVRLPKGGHPFQRPIARSADFVRVEDGRQPAHRGERFIWTFQIRPSPPPGLRTREISREGAIGGEPVKRLGCEHCIHALIGQPDRLGRSVDDVHARQPSSQPGPRIGHGLDGDDLVRRLRPGAS